MKKLSIDDTDIDILVKKSIWLFWFGFVGLLAPVVGFSIGFVDALMYESEHHIYWLLLLAGLIASLILFILFVVKTNPGTVRKKYQYGYKIIEDLRIEQVRTSERTRSSEYTLYYMKLSNGKELRIESKEYREIKEGRIKYARLETAEVNGKTISCKVLS